MIQFYFLSIFCNAAAGYILISPDNREDQHTLDLGLSLSVHNDTLRLILGILSIITGLFKILSPVQGDVPVIGDLFPGLCGFTAGFTLIFEYYRKLATLQPDSYTLLEQILVHNKKRIGFWSLGAAVLHFLFPQALLI